MSSAERGASTGPIGYLDAQVDGGADVFCEVRSLSDVIVARGRAEGAFAVPPDTYFVTARGSDGTTFAARVPVDVEAGKLSAVQLQMSSRAVPLRNPGPALTSTRAAPTADGLQSLVPQLRTSADAVMDGEGSSSTEAVAVSKAGTFRTIPDIRLFITSATRPLGDPRIHMVEGLESVYVVCHKPTTIELAAAWRDGPRRLYRIPVPVDRTGPTTLVVTRRRTFLLGDGLEEQLEFDKQESGTDRGPGNPGRFVCDVELMFADPHLQHFWRLVTEAAFEEAWSQSEAMAPDLMHIGKYWLRDKLASPVAATLGAYVLLRANRLEQAGPWSKNLLGRFPDDADAIVIRAEVLSRLGEHGEAARLLSELDRVGWPWMRSGLQYAWQLASTYVAALDQRPLQSLEASIIGRVQKLRPVLGRMNGNADQRRVNTVIYWPLSDTSVQGNASTPGLNP